MPVPPCKFPSLLPQPTLVGLTRTQVASQETQMKQDGYSYSLEASRQYHSRGSTTVPPLAVQPVTHYPEEVTPLPPNDALAYRHGSAPFTYNPRPFDPVGTWPTALPVEQSVSYHVYSPVYDQEPAYACPPNTTTLVHRSAHATSADSTCLGFQSVPPGHPETPTDVTAVVALPPSDRILPTPGSHRGSVMGSSSSGLSSYRSDSPSPVYGSSKPPTSSQSPQTSISTSGTGPVTPGSEASSYASYEPSSSMPPAVPSYAPIALTPQLTRPGDMYGPSSAGPAMYSSPPANGSSGDSLRGSGSGSASGPDMTYRYTDTTTTENGTPTVGPIMPKLERRASPSNSAALALAHPSHEHHQHAQSSAQPQHQHQEHHHQHHHHQHVRHHHHEQTFVAQGHGQHASYMVPSEADAPGSEAASADGERKPAVLHT